MIVFVLIPESFHLICENVHSPTKISGHIAKVMHLFWGCQSVAELLIG